MSVKAMVMMVCVVGFYGSGFIFLVNKAFNSK